VRQESFGALLFNPLLSEELKLSQEEASITGLCDGSHSIGGMADEICRRYGVDPETAGQRVDDTLDKLSGLMAISWSGTVTSRRPAILRATRAGERPYLSTPKEINWDVTHACNLRCPHCLTASGRRREDELSTAEALGIIDMLADAKVFYLLITGGEPFLRPDIFRLLGRLSETNMHVEVVTNAVSLDRKAIEKLPSYRVANYQVSIDGIGDRHDAFRGKKGAFKAACRNITRMVDNGIVVNISMAITRENLDQVNSVIDLAVDLGCGAFIGSPVVPVGRGLANCDRLTLDKDGYLQFYKTLHERAGQLKGMLNISTEKCFQFLFERPLPGVGDDGRIGDDGRMGCAAGNDMLGIGADGTVYPCSFLRDFPLGNLRDTTLIEIWDGAPILGSLRALKKKNMNGPCATCKYAPEQCQGGCRARAFYGSRDLRARDPACFLPIKNIKP